MKMPPFEHTHPDAMNAHLSNSPRKGRLLSNAFTPTTLYYPQRRKGPKGRRLHAIFQVAGYPTPLDYPLLPRRQSGSRPSRRFAGGILPLKPLKTLAKIHKGSRGGRGKAHSEFTARHGSQPPISGITALSRLTLPSGQQATEAVTRLLTPGRTDGAALRALLSCPKCGIFRPALNFRPDFQENARSKSPSFSFSAAFSRVIAAISHKRSQLSRLARLGPSAVGTGKTHSFAGIPASGTGRTKQPSLLGYRFSAHS